MYQVVRAARWKLGSNFFLGHGMVWPTQLKTIPPRLLADLLGGMVGLVLGGQDHTPYAFGNRTIPRKKLGTQGCNKKNSGFAAKNQKDSSKQASLTALWHDKGAYWRGLAHQREFYTKEKANNAPGSTNKTLWWRRAVLPSLPWVVCFLSFYKTLSHE